MYLYAFIAVVIFIVIFYKQKTLTVVSAYFDIKSKRSDNEYDIRMKNLLSKLNCNLVFYTTPDKIEILKEYRGIYADKTTFIPTELDNISAIRKFGLDFWKIQNQLYDDARYKDMPYLGAVWYSKKDFMLDAITQNIYNTTHFAWVDAGVYDRDITGSTLNVNSNLLTNKIVMYGLTSIKSQTTEYFNSKIEDFIAGDTYIGDKESIVDYIRLYDQTVDEYLEKNMCIYMDQNIMSTIVVRLSDKFILFEGYWRTLFKKLLQS